MRSSSSNAIVPASYTFLGMAVARVTAMLPDRRLLGLFLLSCPIDGGAENVAERGAGIGGAVLLHCGFVFVDLALLDRKRELARGLVDIGDFCIHLLAYGEAVGPLLAAVARDVDFADEALRAVVHGDL